MRAPSCAVIATALALAACGEDQTAQNAPPPAPPAPAQPQVAQPAPPPAPAPAPAPQVARPAEPAPGVQPRSGAGTTASLPPQGSPSATNVDLDNLFGRTFRGGPASLQLSADGTFTMQEADANRSVRGRYSYVSGTITFLDAEGDTGAARFPLRCSIDEVSPEGFRLTNPGGSAGETCQSLHGVTFRPAT